MTSKSQPENVFNDLYRRVYVTARSSFCAARRLEQQSKWSQWTVTLASVALIIIPLVQSMDMPLIIDKKILNVLEIFLAIIVLVFSLLISAENYQLKASEMQQRGLELAKIYYALEPYRVKTGDIKLYEKFYTDYDQILSRHENHLPIDYDEHRLLKREDFYPKYWDFVLAWVSFKVQRFILITPYLILLIPCVYLVIFLLIPSLNLSF